MNLFARSLNLTGQETTEQAVGKIVSHIQYLQERLETDSRSARRSLEQLAAENAALRQELEQLKKSVAEMKEV